MTTTVIPPAKGENPTEEKLINTTTSSDVIKVCSPFFSGIPQELKAISQWVVWNNNTKDTPRGSKQPRHTSSPYAVSALDSNHWFDFTTACDTYEKMGVSGVGFTFTKEVGMTTIDVDGCVDYNDDGEGIVNELGQSVLDKFANDTYAEISFHLDGIHIITYGNLPEGEVGGHRKNAAGQQIEMYDASRFIAITGRKVSTCNAHVGHCEAVLAELCEEYKCVVKKRPDRPKNTIVGNSQSIGDKLGLQCMSIAPPYKSFVRGEEIVGCNPISGHNNTSGTAYNVNPRKNTWYCWADECGGDALMLYAMEKGFISCGHEISDYAELFAALRDDGYNLDVLDPTYDPHCGDDLKMTNVGKVEKVEERAVVKMDYDFFKFPIDEGNIIQKWTEFGKDTQDAYPEYHSAGMMTVLSHIISAEMRPQHGALGNNMWFFILGASGTSGKSTANNAIMALAREEKLSPYVHRITTKITPEAWVLAFRLHRRQLHYSDEGVGFLKFLKKDYATELNEDYIKAYDGTDISKTLVPKRGKDGDMDTGIVIAQNPKISALWNTTPESFGCHATRDQFASGFFLRACFLTPNRDKEIKRDAPISVKAQELRNEIIIHLSELCSLVGGRTVVFNESEYIAEWKYSQRVKSSKYKENHRSALTRAYDHARKVAMNLTLGSSEFLNLLKNEMLWDGEPLLRPMFIEGVDIPDEYAKIACYLAEEVFLPASLDALKLTYGNGHYGRVMKMFEESSRVSRTEIGDAVCKSGRQLTEFISELPVVALPPTTSNGACKPTQYYQLS